MADGSPGHLPVLASEVIELLAPVPGETAVDCTVGRGGHSLLLAEAVGPRGLVVGLDLDRANLEYAARRLEAEGLSLRPVHDSFVRAAAHVAEAGLRADVVLADLGFSSNQMDDAGRGMSFGADGPLDMRYDTRGPVTAADLLARCTEAELAEIIGDYGEDPLAAKIARKLAQARQRQPIGSTGRLAGLVEEAYGPRAARSRMHPATRTFMALRIAVNDELSALQALLEHVRRGAEERNAGGWLMPGARVAIISFHSLEDRLVKRAFAEMAESGLATRLTRRPVTAGAAEVGANPRSRSARLRAVQIAGSQMP